MWPDPSIYKLEQLLKDSKSNDTSIRIWKDRIAILEQEREEQLKELTDRFEHRIGHIEKELIDMERKREEYAQEMRAVLRTITEEETGR
jgi:hypothetical protein